MWGMHQLGKSLDIIRDMLLEIMPERDDSDDHIDHGAA